MTTTNNTHDATITIPDTKSAPSDLDALDFGWTENDRIVALITRMARLRWLNTHGNVTGTRTFNQNSCVACEKTSMKRDDEQISFPSKEQPNEYQSI